MKIKEERKLMEKLNRGRTLSEKAYDALCNVIRKMAPGNNRLPSEDDLANNMGVSRATIREALKHLMLDGVTTTIHGKGTFAHPSVFEIENRIDLYSDFYMMLTEHFGPPTVVNDWLGETEPSELYIENFGNTRKPISTGWLYIAEERPRIYGLFEICPDFVTREITGVENITSLPQLSLKYMNAPIDYCSMTARMGKSARAAQRLGLEQDVDQPLMYWERCQPRSISRQPGRIPALKVALATAWPRSLKRRT